MPAIAVDHLRKVYRGTTAAVDDISFEVPRGGIVGFLGPNGAGKTTTLRMLLGLAKPTSGSVQILGTNAASAGNAIRQQIGYLPDAPGFPDWMTAPEFLRFAGSLFGLPPDVANARVGSLLDMAGLVGVTQRIGEFSRGMKQRLGVAQALVNAPRLLLLDEPTSALDPLGRKEVLDMIEALRGKATVVFSTHLLDDVERVCDSAIILNHGRVVTTGTIPALRSRYGGSTRIRVVVHADAPRLGRRIAEAVWAADVTVDGDTVSFSTDAPHTAGLQMPALIDDVGCGLGEYGRERVTLEDVFVHLTKERT